MKVRSTTPSQSAAGRRTGKVSPVTGEGKFASLLQVDAPTEIGSPAAAGAVQALDSLLAAQEIPDRAAGRKRALRHVQELLDQLEIIRMGLLAGTIPGQRLRALVGLLSRSRADIGDPGLEELIEAIELRAAVEMAKLDQREPG